jgi:type IV pilus assembly protein PilC
MPEYKYEGVDKEGKSIQGQLNATSDGELRMMLREMRIRPKKVSQVRLKAPSSLVKIQSLPIHVLVGFTRQLQVLIGSGIPIVQGLEILNEQASNLILKIIVAEVKEKVSAGSYFWEALSAYPLVFPKLYIALIRAGESSGSLDQMLKRLTRYVEDADRMRKLIKSAMMYPIIVISVGIGVISLMMVFVIPKFEEMLRGNGQALPLATQFVINVSHFMISNILYILGSVLGLISLTVRYLKTPEGRGFRDRVVFRIPLFGTMAQKSGIARFSRTLQTLLASGVNLIDAIDICKATIDNAVLEDAVSKIRGEIEGGQTLGMVVGKIPLFPRMAVQMIAVGESTGNIDKMLEKVADFYESEVEIMVNGMTKLIEPIVLVFLGATVGGLMIAMYLPIFKMAGGAE